MTNPLGGLARSTLTSRRRRHDSTAYERHPRPAPRGRRRHKLIRGPSTTRSSRRDSTTASLERRHDPPTKKHRRAVQANEHLISRFCERQRRRQRTARQHLRPLGPRLQPARARGRLPSSDPSSCGVPYGLRTAGTADDNVYTRAARARRCVRTSRRTPAVESQDLDDAVHPGAVTPSQRPQRPGPDGLRHLPAAATATTSSKGAGRQLTTLRRQRQLPPLSAAGDELIDGGPRRRRAAGRARPDLFAAAPATTISPAAFGRRRPHGGRRLATTSSSPARRATHRR